MNYTYYICITYPANVEAFVDDKSPVRYGVVNVNPLNHSFCFLLGCSNCLHKITLLSQLQLNIQRNIQISRQVFFSVRFNMTNTQISFSVCTKLKKKKKQQTNKIRAQNHERNVTKRKNKNKISNCCFGESDKWLRMMLNQKIEFLRITNTSWSFNANSKTDQWFRLLFSCWFWSVARRLVAMHQRMGKWQKQGRHNFKM